MLGLVCLVGGASLAFTAIQQMARLGGNAPYLRSLVAFDQPASSDLADVLGPAAKSVDNLTFFLTIAWTAVAAVLLIVAAGFFLSSGHLRHPDAARRVAGVGLWMALGVAVVSLIPFDAGWADAGLGSSAFDSVRSGLIALAGLLLLQISAPQWRESVRGAFRD
jgi:hypothetical protein